MINERIELDENTRDIIHIRLLMNEQRMKKLLYETTDSGIIWF
jgi:hypothetical protein